MAKEKVHIKHIEIYIILFVLLVAGAITAFVIAFTGLKGDSTIKQYYIVGLENYDEIPYYGQDINFAYYLEGTETENSKKLDDISAQYSERLSYIYASLDDAEVYPHYPSIGLLNQKPNEDVELSEFTYNVLKDAYDKTLESNNYSVFAQPFETEWYKIFSLPTDVERKEMDPLNNADTNDLLLSIASFIDDREKVDLEFKDNYVVKLKVSADYMEFLEDNGLHEWIVGLNILKTSYIAKHISSYLNAYNLDKGYLYTIDGKVIQLNHNPTTVRYNYYDSTIDENGNVLYYNAADITINPYSFVLANRRFALDPMQLQYYYIKHNDTYYFRSLNIDIHTGQPHNEVRSTNIYGNGDDDIVELSYINNELSAFTTVEDMKAYLTSKGKDNIKLLIGLNDNNKNIYYTETVKDYVSLSQELDYNLIKI